ncbi:MAG: hypothetical protein EON93_19270, partial [Burkholderiales bacterium]
MQEFRCGAASIDRYDRLCGSAFNCTESATKYRSTVRKLSAFAMWQAVDEYPAFTVTSAENARKTRSKAEGSVVQGYLGGSLSKSLYPAAVSAALLFATAFIPGTAIAQVGPGAGSPPIVPITPSRDELDRQRPDSQAPRSARLKIDGDIERAPCALDAPQYADIRTNITEAQFNN